VPVAVYRWGDRLDNAINDLKKKRMYSHHGGAAAGVTRLGVLTDPNDRPFVLLRYIRIHIAPLPLNIIGFNNGRKHWKPALILCMSSRVCT
jgi:hypothetical protein